MVVLELLGWVLNTTVAISVYVLIGLLALTVLLLVITALVLRFKFVQPAPPATVVDNTVPPAISARAEDAVHRLVQIPALHTLQPVGWRRLGPPEAVMLWVWVLTDGTTIAEVGVSVPKPKHPPVLLLTSFVFDGAGPRRVATTSQSTPDLALVRPVDIEALSVRAWSPEALAALHGAHLAGRRLLPLPGDPMALIEQGEHRSFNECFVGRRFRRHPDGTIRLTWWGVMDLTPRFVFAEQPWAKRRHDRRASQLMAGS